MVGWACEIGSHNGHAWVHGPGRAARGACDRGWDGGDVSEVQAAWCLSRWVCGSCRRVGAVRCMCAMCMFGLNFVSGATGGAMILGG